MKVRCCAATALFYTISLCQTRPPPFNSNLSCYCLLLTDSPLARIWNLFCLNILANGEPGTANASCEAFVIMNQTKSIVDNMTAFFFQFRSRKRERACLGIFKPHLQRVRSYTILTGSTLARKCSRTRAVDFNSGDVWLRKTGILFISFENIITSAISLLRCRKAPSKTNDKSKAKSLNMVEKTRRVSTRCRFLVVVLSILMLAAFVYTLVCHVIFSPSIARGEYLSSFTEVA